ncbi:hypothetical protein [Clostridium sp.]|uniref:hypothetical protein n=1 Tax=Clostridium sp. TaxID=1506 RepID=UPI002FCB8BD2
MRGKKKYKKITILILTVIILLWTLGVIPKAIGETVSINYIEKYYSSLNLEFKEIEYSKSQGAYISAFIDKKGKVYNVLMNSKWLPINIYFNPLNIPK